MSCFLTASVVVVIFSFLIIAWIVCVVVDWDSSTIDRTDHPPHTLVVQCQLASIARHRMTSWTNRMLPTVCPCLPWPCTPKELVSNLCCNLMLLPQLLARISSIQIRKQLRHALSSAAKSGRRKQQRKVVPSRVDVASAVAANKCRLEWQCTHTRTHDGHRV